MKTKIMDFVSQCLVLKDANPNIGENKLYILLHNYLKDFVEREIPDPVIRERLKELSVFTDKTISTIERSDLNLRIHLSLHQKEEILPSMKKFLTTSVAKENVNKDTPSEHVLVVDYLDDVLLRQNLHITPSHLIMNLMIITDMVACLLEVSDEKSVQLHE